jgi:hypothetical protein
MAHGTVSFQTDNIHCEATKLTLDNQLNVEGEAIYFNNPVYFMSRAGFCIKPQLQTQISSSSGHEQSIECYFNDFDMFWHFGDPLLNFNITYCGGNHIVQFEIMTQEDLDMEPGGVFDFSLNFDWTMTDININKPFNFEPGKKYMIIFQQTEENGPVNIFWTELTDYAN